MKRIVAIVGIGFLCILTGKINKEPSTAELQVFTLANYFQFNPVDKTALDKASYLYDQLKNESFNAGFFVGYVPFLETQNPQALMPLIPDLDKHYADNLEIDTSIASALAKAGKTADAQARLIKLNDKHSNQELAFKVAQIYLARQEPENALRVIDTLLNTSPRKPNNFIFHFLKGQIYVSMNKKDEALAALKTSLEMHPKFDKAWLLLGAIEEQAGNLPQAITHFITFLELTPERNKEIEAHVLQLAVKQKGSKAHHDPLMHLCVKKAMAFFEQKEFRRGLQEIEGCNKKKSFFKFGS